MVQDGLDDSRSAVGGARTLRRARGKGLRPHDALRNNDAGRFFDALGDALLTGPTFTNVNDFRAIVIDPDGARI